MGRILFVTGGRRSGKSAFAQALAEKMDGERVYIATSPALDGEMAARIEAHKKAREGKGWRTIEEQTDLAGAIGRAGAAGVALVECLTLWVNNILYHNDSAGAAEVEAAMALALAQARGGAGTVIFVSNEVGWCVTPENALARRFSDLAGMVNQLAAREADEAYMVISGIPQKIK